MSILREGNGPVVLEAEVYRYYLTAVVCPVARLVIEAKDEEEEARKRDIIEQLAGEMITRGWLNDEGHQAIKAAAIDLAAYTAARLTEPNGKKRRIAPSLWPDPAFRDKGLRGDLSEFDAIEFVEQESLFRHCQGREVYPVDRFGHGAAYGDR